MGIMTLVITWPIWFIGIGIMIAVRSRMGERRRRIERAGERDREDVRPGRRART
jgi:hypothetical protein